MKEQIDASIDPIKQGGMTNVIMRKFRDDNELHGYTDVRVQASNEFPKTGVFIAVNDHYQIDSRPTYTAADLIRSDLVDYKADLMLVLEKNFDASITASRKIMDGVLGGE